MKNTPLLAALLLALPIAVSAQTTTKTTTSKTTTPTGTIPAGMQQQTEVTEDLDPATGKVIRRTTRTVNVPIGTPAPVPSTSSTTTADDYDTSVTAASDAQVTDFLRQKTAVSTLSTAGLLRAYEYFIERVRADRSAWKPADWSTAAAVLSSLNGRYQQLRPSFSFDDKVTIRSQQAEFQALRTAKQISTSVSDKL